MKLVELQTRRRSKEELEALKQAPDYWKKELRKEFNSLVKRYGASSKDVASRHQASHNLMFDRDIFVAPDAAAGLTLQRSKRTRALVLAVARWLHQQLQKGLHVRVVHRLTPSVTIPASATVEDIHRELLTSTNIEHWLQWVTQKPWREANPLRFDLRFLIRTIPVE
jgi:4-alpha-glucanotransferase